MSTQQQLTEARGALHRLIIGESMVSLQRDGKRVEFAQANRSDLERYIAHLEAQLGVGQPRRRGPAGVIA
jgi:hypothetical protein